MKVRLLGIFVLINIIMIPLAYAEEGPTVEFFLRREPLRPFAR